MFEGWEALGPIPLIFISDSFESLLKLYKYFSTKVLLIQYIKFSKLSYLYFKGQSLATKPVVA